MTSTLGKILTHAAIFILSSLMVSVQLFSLLQSETTKTEDRRTEEWRKEKTRNFNEGTM